MIIDLKVLDEVKFKFLELGVSVTEMASKNDAYFKNIYFSMERLNTMMKSVIDDDQLEVVAKHADAIVNQFKKVDDIFADMAKSYKGADVLGDSLNNLNSKFDKMSTDLTSMKAEKTANDKKKLEEKKNEAKDKRSKPGYLDKEMQGVMGKLNSLMSRMMIPSAGALLAGGIGILAYGVSEQQRMKAEAGEASDIIVVAADGHLKKLKNRATAFLSGFQESLQKFYGVSRQEVQAAAKVFSEGGTQIADWMKGRDASLGMVGRNFLSFSLGVDKLLNVAGGTTARAMVDYAERYGMSLEESKNTLTRMLEIGGEEGGLGFVRFSKMVNEAAPALERLGFSVDATTEFMGKMQGAFEGLKIPKQMAGNLLVKGTQKMAEGLSSMSEGWVRAFAERMGMGEGPEAVQKFREYWVRMMKTKGNPEEFDKFINLIVEESLKLFEGNELKTRYFMSNVLGMGTEGAFLATESYKAGKNPDLNPKKKYDAAKKARESLKDAYKTEREKRTEWELGMNEWMKAISKIGIAALSLLARALGKMVLFFRSIPTIVSNLMNDNKKQGREDNEKLFNRIEELMSDDGKSFKLLKQGFEELGIAGKKLLGASFGENLDAISNAFSEDPFSLSDSDREKSRKNATGGAVGSSYTPPSSVRVVTVPVERLGSVDVHSPKEDLRSKIGSDTLTLDSDITEWKGKRPLEIISLGVDEQGNIRLALVGECPRCGLPFDDGFDREKFEKSTYVGNSEKVADKTKKSIETLASGVQDAATKHIAALRAEGIDARISRAKVTTEEQKRVYEKNKKENPNAVVAKPGTSKHETGEAYDIKIYDKEGKYISKGSDPAYKRAGEIGKELGLEWGGEWDKKDMPHFQMKK